MLDEKFKIAEQKLYDYQKIKIEINSIKLDLKKIENSDRLDQIEFFKKEILEREIQIQKIENAMDLLNEEERKIVEYRYLKKKGSSYKWEYISSMVGFSVSQCKKMRVNIINKIKELI
ncbi:hypothetical protein [Intestinibacter sp.]|uniref:hypothetical protein n=1 Tax=Intestinibacter sp. TaxID=1965304 RepID=UPI002A761E0B|nr:hypothetical protein [Intestinibacter sp.]MDY2734966.1 hypothetical protein [Intestinibacter sp.]